jgi:predicted ATPase/DNA-binding CsgD family transcriptional regulator
MNFYLPAQARPLIGRSKELAASRLCLSNGTRLLTLTGPAGVGKTRLAVAVAGECSDSFSHGARFVGLASASDPEAVPEAICRMLGVREVADRPLIEVLAEHLRERHMLIVLDNVEHLLPAVERVGALLSACPKLVVLATSRERLRLRWEQPLVVPPLELPFPDRAPTPEELSKVPSATLFVERVRSVRPGFELTEENAPAVAEICRRLDGLPLAIELAAARTGVLSPAELLARFGSRLPSLGRKAPDAPERHRTLRSAVGWSYDLLLPEEQQLFGRLGVFADGWTLEAAEAIGDAEGQGVDVLDALESLVDKSLIQVAHEANGEARFGMLETMKEYALEQLRERGGLETARKRHVDHFLALAETAAPELRSIYQVVWQARLEREHENLRTALDWALEAGRGDIELRLTAALGCFWYFQAHIGEGRNRLERALARDPGCPTAVRVEALTWCAYFAWAQRDYDAAAPLYEEAIALSRDDAQERSSILPIAFLGKLSWPAGDYDRAAELHEEALALSRKNGDRWSEGVVLAELAMTRRLQGDTEDTERILEKSLVLNREMCNSYHLAQVLATLADLVGEQGDVTRAASLLAESLALSWRSDQRGMLAYGFSMTTRFLAEHGDPERAARLLAATDGMDVLSGWRRTHTEEASYAKGLHTVRSKLDEPRMNAALETGRAMPLERIVDETLEALADASESPKPVADPARNTEDPLSERELEVLRLVAEGFSDGEIAQKLFIAERTARFHVTSMRKKLRASTRAHAVAIAAQSGIL